jgi:hypothetical protein
MVIIAIRSRSLNLIRYSFIILFLYFGMFINFTDQQDGFRHRKKVEYRYFEMGLEEFVNITKKLITFKPVVGLKEDLYIHFISYISGFFGSLTALHLIASVIMALFVSKSIVNLIRYCYSNSINNYSWNYTLYSLFFILTLVFQYSFIGVNSIRAWTGMWALFWVGTEVYLKKKHNYTLLFLIGPFFHFMYIPLSIISILHYYYIKQHSKLIMIFFICSFFVPLLNFDIVSVIPRLDYLEGKVEAYSEGRESALAAAENTNLTDLITGGANFYVRGVKIALTYVLPLIILLIWYLRKNLPETLFYLFLFGVLIYSISNIFSLQIPSLTGRYQNNSFLYILAPLIYITGFKYFTHRSTRVSFQAILFLLIPNLAYTISLTIGYFSIYSLFSPIVWFFSPDNISIKEFLNKII